ncbi:MAG: dihydrofolate reductase [Bacteroidetes bacterium]|jgi:dihydrofolate reductase|nr:dihydrofolate reductase [Bacteroidota bacterium]MDF1863221.1 dihydrofolate reductase [Saprospiraceae bacterium]
MIVSTIVAVANNYVIGKDNQIPWYLPADLKYFKKTTLGHHIIMGRNCYESIGRPLPKRTNVIITRNPFYVASGCLVTHSIQEALDLADNRGETEAFIIGGGEIYKQSEHLWDKVYLTEVDLEVEGDVFFPKIDFKNWDETYCESHDKDTKNEFNYIFKIFEKK